MSLTVHRCTPRQATKFISAVIEAGLVPFVQSSPGLGKSSIMRGLAKKFNLKLIDHRLSTSEPTDMTGLPSFENGYAVFKPFRDLFPLMDQPLPVKMVEQEQEDGSVILLPTQQKYDGWMVFLDEFNSATKQMQAASYKVILDRMIGQNKLHPNSIITLAGNLTTDRAITNILSTAMQSRVVHIEMVENFTEWLEDVALPEKYDHRLIAFLSANPHYLMDFRPDHNEKTFCCPRTWEFMNKLVAGNPVTDGYAPLYAGTITSGVALSLIQFVQVYASLVKVEDVLAMPQSCPVPVEVPAKWAITSSLLEHVENTNFDKMVQYINRFDVSFRILFTRGVIARAAHLRNHPSFVTLFAPIAALMQ